MWRCRRCMTDFSASIWPRDSQPHPFIVCATVYVCYRSKIIRHWHASLTPRIAFFHQFSCFFSLVTHLSAKKRENHDEIIPVQLSTLKGFISNGMLNQLHFYVFFSKEEKTRCRKRVEVQQNCPQKYTVIWMIFRLPLRLDAITIWFYFMEMPWTKMMMLQPSLCIQWTESSRKEWKLLSS